MARFTFTIVVIYLIVVISINDDIIALSFFLAAANTGVLQINYAAPARKLN